MASTQHPIDYGWKEALHWISFFDTWWGTDQELEVNGVLDVGEPTEDLSVLLWTKGRVFIRQEYSDFYDRLEASSAKNMGGRVVSGSPGIGKSAFLLYVLARRLKKCEITLFYTAYNQLYLFYTDAVYKLSGDFWVPKHLRSLMLSTERVWTLIDTGSTATNPPLSLTRPRSLFPVHAASPNRQHYAGWTKQHSGVRLIMNPWTEEELHQALVLHLQLSHLSVEDTQKARKDFGPCIRDVINGLLEPDSLNVPLEETLLEIRPNNISQIIQLVNAARETTNLATAPHTLFFVERRSPSAILDHTGPDYAIVEVKTLDIAKRLLFQYERLDLRDAQYLYRLCRPTPETSILAGWLFEKIAIEYLSGTATLPGFIQDMYPMALDETEDVDVDPPSFVYSPSDTDTSELRVGPWGVEIVELHPPEPVTLPITPRPISNDLDDLYFNRFCVPKSKDHPLFDAAFFSPPRGDPGVLWILQMTTSARVGGSANGYDVVRDLRSKLKYHPNCAVKYVLVVPSRERQRTVWTMPDGWKEDVKGQVYVQFLAMDKFTDAILM